MCARARRIGARGLGGLGFRGFEISGLWDFGALGFRGLGTCEVGDVGHVTTARVPSLTFSLSRCAPLPPCIELGMRANMSMAVR